MNKVVLIIVGAAVVLGVLWYSGVFESKQGGSPSAPVVEQSKPEENTATEEQTAPVTEATEPVATPAASETPATPEVPAAAETAGGNTTGTTEAPTQESGTTEAPASK